MKTLIRTNNPVTLSFAQAVLKDADIPCFVFDEGVSSMDGSIGAIPRRLRVDDADYKEARAALTDADLGEELADLE